MSAVVAQFGNPSGPMGAMVAFAMHEAHAPDYAAVLAEVPMLQGLRLLEVGMGAALHVPGLLARGVEYTGVDRSPDMVASASATVPDAVFICADVCASVLPECDVAIAVNTVQWWSSPIVGLRSIRNALVESGKLVIGISTAPPCGLIPNAGQRHYTPDELRTMLKDVGFSSVSVTVISVARRPYILARGVA